MISKQSGYLTGVGSAVTMLIVAIAIFWLALGIGLGYLLWG